MAVAIPRPAVATTVGRPRRSDAPSSTSSCTSVAEWISSTATAARRSPSCSPSTSPRREEDEQRPQPLAAGADRRARVLREQLAVRVRELLQPLLEPLHQPRDVRPARLDERDDLLGAAHATVPECRAMMPPAVRIQRTSRSPAAAIRPASASGSGKRLTERGRYL